MSSNNQPKAFAYCLVCDTVLAKNVSPAEGRKAADEHESDATMSGDMRDLEDAKNHFGDADFSNVTCENKGGSR